MNKRKTRASRRRVRNRVVISATAAIVLVAGFLWVTRDSEANPPNAAPDITLQYFDGTSQQLSELRGKPVVLNFWASWCPACVSEMPSFGEVHRQFGDEVEFVGINMQEVDLDAAAALVDQTNVDYRLAHDPIGAIYNQFGGIAMPTTVFISAEGAIELVHVGTIFEEDLIQTIESELFG